MSRDDLVAEALTRVKEIMPWDLRRMLVSGTNPLTCWMCANRPSLRLLHIRNRSMCHLPGVEQACEWDYDETIAGACQRAQQIVVICRFPESARRLPPMAMTRRLGFTRVISLRNRRARLERLRAAYGGCERRCAGYGCGRYCLHPTCAGSA